VSQLGQASGGDGGGAVDAGEHEVVCVSGPGQWCGQCGRREFGAEGRDRLFAGAQRGAEGPADGDEG